MTSAEFTLKIATLRLEQDYVAALELARRDLASLESDPSSIPYEVKDAERLVRTLELACSLSVEDQRLLSEADRMGQQIELHMSSSDFGSAITQLETQLQIRRDLLGESNVETVVSMKNLATSHFYAQDTHSALRMIREYLEAFRRILGEDHPLYASSLSALGAISLSTGDFTTAQVCIKGSLSRQRLLRGSPNKISNDLNNLAILNTYQGDYSAAEALYEEALEIYRAEDPPDLFAVARVLNNLSLMLQDRKEFARAEALCRESLALRRSLFGNEHLESIISLNNLGHLLSTVGRTDEAVTRFEEALDLIRAKGDGNTLVGQLCARNVATTRASISDGPEVDVLFQSALEVASQCLSPGNPEYCNTLRNLGEYHLRYRRFDQSEAALVDAARHHDLAHRRAVPGFNRATFTLESPYPQLALARVSLRRWHQAWVAAETGQARSLTELIISSEGRNLTPAEAAEEARLSQKISDAESQTETLARSVDPNSDVSDSEVEAQLLQARSDLYEASSKWAELQSALDDKYRLAGEQIFSLERIQSRLNESDALIGWVDGDRDLHLPSTWCYVIRNRGGVAWFERPLSMEASAASEERVLRFRQALTDPGIPIEEIRGLGHAVWQDRIHPLQSALDNVDSLIVIPTGVMSGVPIEALVDEAGQWLADCLRISYAPSATIRTWLESKPRRTDSSEREVLLLGDPLLSPESFDQPRDVATVYRSAIAGRREAMQQLPRLHGARAEVQGIASVHGSARLLLGSEATERELRRLAHSDELRRFHTLHFATHALVDEENVERSCLVLSTAHLPDPLESAISGERIDTGRITVANIVRDWKLEADLVTLSACETGLGRAVRGEGIIGFAHAFLCAGARSLLVSMWRVDDWSTSLLMRRFYATQYDRENFGATGTGSPLKKGEALREARHWLRSLSLDEVRLQLDDLHRLGEDSDEAPALRPGRRGLGDTVDVSALNNEIERPYEHPFYWAPFVLMGATS